MCVVATNVQKMLCAKTTTVFVKVVTTAMDTDNAMVKKLYKNRISIDNLKIRKNGDIKIFDHAAIERRFRTGN